MRVQEPISLSFFHPNTLFKMISQKLAKARVELSPRRRFCAAMVCPVKLKTSRICFSLESKPAKQLPKLNSALEA